MDRDTELSLYRRIKQLEEENAKLRELTGVLIRKVDDLVHLISIKRWHKHIEDILKNGKETTYEL